MPAGVYATLHSALVPADSSDVDLLGRLQEQAAREQNQSQLLFVSQHHGPCCATSFRKIITASKMSETATRLIIYHGEQ
jgi:hypothetical protein